VLSQSNNRTLVLSDVFGAGKKQIRFCVTTISDSQTETPAWLRDLASEASDAGKQLMRCFAGRGFFLKV
jgi:hypothetical protein